MINAKQQTIIETKKEVFEGENMQSEHNILSYRVDLYFHKYKLATQVDQFGYDGRNINCEIP